MFVHALAYSLAMSAATPDVHGAGLLADLPRFKEFTAGRHSSYDRTGGNMDGGQDEPIQPGETRTIAQMEGAGAVTHIWMTVCTKDPHYLKNFVLRMYWDGENDPSVESPLGDFFGLGHGRYYAYACLPIQIGTEQGFNCFWRMPYGNGARITVTNEGPIASRAFYFYVDFHSYASLPEDTGRFHAQYRQAFPPTPGENYVFLEATGRGHYVGCNLSIHNRSAGWWGEGDDMFYIDGEERPSLHGTGSEDYFCGAWSYGKPFSNLYFGCPLIEGGHVQNALWNVYRYHLEDPIPFTKSIRVTIEHGHANKRDDDLSSVAYWYQSEPHVPFPPLPAPELRYPPEATVFTEAWVEEVEDMKEAFGSDEVVEQPMLEFGNHWSRGKQLLFRAKGPSVYRAALPIEPGDAGIHDLEVWYTAGPDYGLVELHLNGKKIAEWDGYHAGGYVRKKWESASPITLTRDPNIVELRVAGKNEASSGFLAGWDCFRLHEQMAWWEIPHP